MQLLLPSVHPPHPLSYRCVEANGTFECAVCSRLGHGARYRCPTCAGVTVHVRCALQTYQEGAHDELSEDVRVWLNGILRSDRSPRILQVHDSIKCDGCSRSPIVGLRFSCRHPECCRSGDSSFFDYCHGCVSRSLPSIMREQFRGWHADGHVFQRIHDDCAENRASNAARGTGKPTKADSLPGRTATDEVAVKAFPSFRHPSRFLSTKATSRTVGFPTSEEPSSKVYLTEITSFLVSSSSSEEQLRHLHQTLLSPECTVDMAKSLLRDTLLHCLTEHSADSMRKVAEEQIGSSLRELLDRLRSDPMFLPVQSSTGVVANLFHDYAQGLENNQQEKSEDLPGWWREEGGGNNRISFDVFLATIWIRVLMAGPGRQTCDRSLVAYEVEKASPRLVKVSEFGSLPRLFLLPLKEALELPTAPPHRDCSQTDTLDPTVARDVLAVFVSHTWKEKDHPDPEGDDWKALLSMMFDLVDACAGAAEMLQSWETNPSKYFSVGSKLNCVIYPSRMEGGVFDQVMGQVMSLALDLSLNHNLIGSALRHRITEKIFLWVDFCCLPQGDRTEAEEALFRQSLDCLPDIQMAMYSLVLNRTEDYKARAWCFAELLWAGEKAPSLFNEDDTIYAEAVATTTAALVCPSFKDPLRILSELDLKLFHTDRYAFTVCNILWRSSTVHRMSTIFNPLLNLFSTDQYIFIAAGSISKVRSGISALIHMEDATLDGFLSTKPDEWEFDRYTKPGQCKHLFFYETRPGRRAFEEALRGCLCVLEQALADGSEQFFLVSLTSSISPALDDPTAVLAGFSNIAEVQPVAHFLVTTSIRS